MYDDLRFDLGDKVFIDGYGYHVFEVQAYQIESGYIDGVGDYVDLVYIVQNVQTGEVIEALPSDMKIVNKKNNNSTSKNLEKGLKAMQPKNTVSENSKNTKEEKSKKVEYIKYKNVDEALDMINDLDSLYEMFKDEEFLRQKEKIVKMLNRGIK